MVLLTSVIFTSSVLEPGTAVIYRPFLWDTSPKIFTYPSYFFFYSVLCSYNRAAGHSSWLCMRKSKTRGRQTTCFIQNPTEGILLARLKNTTWSARCSLKHCCYANLLLYMTLSYSSHWATQWYVPHNLTMCVCVIYIYIYSLLATEIDNKE